MLLEDGDSKFGDRVYAPLRAHAARAGMEDGSELQGSPAGVAAALSTGAASMDSSFTTLNPFHSPAKARRIWAAVGRPHQLVHSEPVFRPLPDWVGRIVRLYWQGAETQVCVKLQL